MSVRPMTDEEAEPYFGSGLMIFGQERPKPLNQSLNMPKVCLANDTESEHDGLRAEALRRLKVRRLSEGHED